MKAKKPKKTGESITTGEILETLAILLALVSIIPVAYWWHMGDLGQHHTYFYYLFIMLCILGYVTYRRIKKLRAALKSAKNRSSGPGPKIPPFYQ